jgi:hypothetical protein
MVWSRRRVDGVIRKRLLLGNVVIIGWRVGGECSVGRDGAQEGKMRQDQCWRDGVSGVSVIVLQDIAETPER